MSTPMAKHQETPCRNCTRVKDPRNCENKQCNYWRKWFIERWDAMRKEMMGRR